MNRSYQPEKIEKAEGADWRVIVNPKTREALALGPDEPNPPGWMVLSRFRRVCEAVAQRAVARVVSEAAA